MSRRVVSRATGSYARISRSQFRVLELDGGAGAFVLVGNDVQFIRGGQTADRGTYLLSGQATALLHGAVLSAAAGSYALTGQAASFILGKALPADVGTFLIGGQAAALNRAAAVGGGTAAFVLAGQDAILNKTAAGPALTYIGSVSSAANQTTYDFGDFVIPRDGLVVVGVAGRNTTGSPALSTISIGGTNGTTLVAPIGSSNPTGFAARSVTAGTHNVTVTFTAGSLRASCHVWLLEGLSSTTPVDSEGFNAGTSSTSITLTADISAGGFALYVGMKADITDPNVNFSSATERYDAPTEIQMYAADKTTPTQILNHAETISWTTGTIRSASVVTFR